jgi:hypothetical protein
VHIFPLVKPLKKKLRQGKSGNPFRLGSNSQPSRVSKNCIKESSMCVELRVLHGSL